MRGVAGLSVPFRPRGGQPTLSVLRSALGESFYQIYFQKSGVAEADLARDVRTTIRTVLYGASGQNPTVPDMLVRPGHGFLGEIAPPENLLPRIYPTGSVTPTSISTRASSSSPASLAA